MKKFCTLLLGIMSISSIGVADEPTDLPGYRAAYLLQTIDVEHLSISPAKSRYGHFSYGDSTATVNTVINSTNSKEVGVIAGVRRVHMRLGSSINPHNVSYGVLGLNAKYSAMERWVWVSALVAQPELSSGAFHSARYIGALNGRYMMNDKAGIHVGAYAEVGMRASNVFPVFGLDYSSGNWTWQGVYPLKAGVSYNGIEKHRLSCFIRPFYTAVRVNKGIHYHSSVARYQGQGAELRWDWLPRSRWNLWASIGRTINGNVTVGDTHNHHRHHVHLHQAPYFQVGLVFDL